MSKNSKKIILDLCGGTGSWSKPYAKAGYDVRLVTLPENDVRTYKPPEKVYGILAAPPCTIFSLAGNKYRFEEKKSLTYLDKLIPALELVNSCLHIIRDTRPVFWALENPAGTLKHYLGEPMMYFNPCDFGDAYTKKTALWGNFIPPLPLILGKDNSVEPEFVTLKSGKRMSPMHYNAFHLKPEKRAEVRSVTPPGFAGAFFEVNQ
jgi:hypothetical protein